MTESIGNQMPGLGILDDRLHGRLWHTTHPDRFLNILNDSAIVPNPQISSAKLWGGTPMVRALGGVSLFDFADFDADQCERDYPSSSWAYFVPHHGNWKVAVWIEIDRDFIAGGYRSPSSLLQQWKAEERWSQRIMPGVEAAYIGNLPVAAFKSAFIMWDEGQEVRDLGLGPSERGQLIAAVEEWRSCAPLS